MIIILREVIDDIREKRFLQSYVALLFLVGFTFIELLGSDWSSRFINPVILFALSIIVVDLILTKKREAALSLEINSSLDLQKYFLELSDSYRVSYEFIPMAIGDRTSYSRIRQKATEIISKAQYEVVILDNNNSPLPDNIRYAQGVVDPIDRETYYSELLAKVESPPQESFRYTRIIQVPKNRQLIDVLNEDELLKKHCQEIVGYSSRWPHRATLKIAEFLHEGTLILVDGNYLMFDFMFFEPNDSTISMGGTFFITDREGTMIRVFADFVDFAIASSRRVRPNDLPMHE